MSDLESQIRSAWQCADHALAATLALEGYGPEIHGFLRHGPAGEQADEAYAEFSFDLWRGIGGFAWRASFRTWAYTLARHAALRVGQRRAVTGRETSLSNAPPTAWQSARTHTPLHRRSEIQEQMRRLREQLSEQDRSLLILRIDRGLSWRDLALIFGDEDELADASGRARVAARLRQRFQVVKQRLRRLAEQEGLVSSAV